MPLNIARPDAIETLLTRRSVKTKDMVPPGPSPAELDMILSAARRVPDHGKLAPWRFFVFEGEARQAFGEAIAAAYQAEETAATATTAKAMAAFPAQAPVCIVLASTPSDAKPIPEIEQRLSAGAAGMMLLTAAHMLGHAAQWLTGWAAYSPGVARHLGLAESDCIAGFIFIGSAGREPTERPRPEAAEVVRRFSSRVDVTGG